MRAASKARIPSSTREAYPEKKTRSRRTRSPELPPPHLNAHGQARAPQGGAAGGEARARPRRAAHALAATGTVLARPDPSTDGCARTWLRQRVRGLHEVPERCRAWAETEARQRLGHRAASESTAGELLLVKDEGALLLASPAAKFAQRRENPGSSVSRIPRGEAAETVGVFRPEGPFFIIRNQRGEPVS
eukprot:scaffold8721_cov80-Phaeocystis_antarctica.AAC.18